MERLSYEVFKHLDDMVLEDILALFNTVWAGGCLTKKGMETCGCGPYLEARQRGV